MLVVFALEWPEIPALGVTSHSLELNVGWSLHSFSVVENVSELSCVRGK
jgi:hypothetical protein